MFCYNELMHEFIKMDIFFFVSTIAVVAITTGVVMLMIRLTGLIAALERLSDELKDKAGDIGEEAEEILEHIRESFVFRLIFGGKTRRRTKKK